MSHKLKQSMHRYLSVLLLFIIKFCVVQGFTLRSCHISFGKAICSGADLTEIPTDVPPTVDSIDLSNNKINELQKANFTNFPKVTTLGLGRNRISKLSRGTFSRLFSLTSLKLNGNKLQKLSNGTFEGLCNLTELVISANSISNVEPDAFRSLRNLKNLDLSNNKMRTIEQLGLIIQHTPHLTLLQIKHNSIQTFKSSDLKNTWTELTSLDISLNPLKLFQITTNIVPNLALLNVGDPPMRLTLTWDVPDKSVLAKVKTLDISRVKLASNAKLWNLLSTFNSSLETLRMDKMPSNRSALIAKSCSIPTVSKLQFRQNNLFYLDSRLFLLCTNVTELDLTNNGIKAIDNDTFAPVSHLEVLILNNNKLPTVPHALRNLQTLSELQLTNNSITSIGCDDFANLTRLRRLSLQWNSLTALSPCVFQNLPKLNILELQGNGLAKLNNAFRTSLTNLQTLKLNLNKLTTIKKEEFRGLPSLKNLYLSGNKISTLEIGCFSGLRKLLILQLLDNNLKKQFLSKTFQDLANLQQLDIGQNRIKYDSCEPLENPPFVNLSKLQNFAFQAQQSRGKSHLPSNFLKGLTNLTTLSLRNNQMVSIPNNLFVHTPNLLSLDLNSNDLMAYSPDLFSPIPNLTQLRISRTNCHSLDFLTNANLTKLEFLQARTNSFSVISEDIIKSMPSLMYIDLKYNSFTCDCDNSAFVDWMRNSNQTQVADAYDFDCLYPQHQQGTKLIDLNIQSCTIDVDYIFFIVTTCATLLFLATSLIYHFVRFQLAYAYYIFLAWLEDRKNKSRQEVHQFDAFVSYNVHDEAWVYRELVPHLETEQGWKLCLHHRDFEPGRPIVDNITDAIYGSRKTLCVVSRRYLQSEWCSREMQVASFRLFDEQKDVLILVFLEDIPSSHLSPYYRMRRVLKTQTYLSWPGTGVETNVFWEKLRRALTITKSTAEERLLLHVTDDQ